MAITLPMEDIMPEIINPRNLVIFSKPKCGKTSALLQLPDSLLLDFNKGGSKYFKGKKIEINDLPTLTEVCNAIVAANYPYKYIIVDTLTDVEDIATIYAEMIYSKTPMGKYWFDRNPATPHLPSGKEEYGCILNMPMGSGYTYLRQAFERIKNKIELLAPNIIYTAHLKETILNKGNTEFNSMELNLSGKLKQITTSLSDAIAYMYRGKNDDNYLSFKTTDEVACGTRSPHLQGKEFKISQLIDKGLATERLETYWTEIYR
jgi:hypothetical protein